MIIGRGPGAIRKASNSVRIGHRAEGRVAGKAAIGGKARRLHRLPEAEGEHRRGQRLAGHEPAPEDRGDPVGGIADQRPAGRKAALQHRGQRRANAGQGVNVVMAVDEIGRHAGHRLEAVELALDLAGDFLPVDRPADRPADDAIGRRQVADPAPASASPPAAPRR